MTRRIVTFERITTVVLEFEAPVALGEDLSTWANRVGVGIGGGVYVDCDGNVVGRTIRWREGPWRTVNGPMPEPPQGAPHGRR